jgi:transcriptional/translational regulatory protein YebC/TACO1
VGYPKPSIIKRGGIIMKTFSVAFQFENSGVSTIVKSALKDHGFRGYVEGENENEITIQLSKEDLNSAMEIMNSYGGEMVSLHSSAKDISPIEVDIFNYAYQMSNLFFTPTDFVSEQVELEEETVEEQLEEDWINTHPQVQYPSLKPYQLDHNFGDIEEELDNM